MPSEQELMAEVERQAQEMADALAACEYWHGKALAAIVQEQSHTLDQIERDYRASMARIKASYDQDVAALSETLRQMPWPGLSAADWQDAQWQQYAPDLDAVAPDLTRIGVLTTQGKWSRLQLPALVPIIGSQNLLIKASGAGKDRARQALRSLVLRLLATIAPGKLRLVCIDPVGLGATMAGLIKDLPDGLTGGQAWFESGHIDGQLAALEAHMAMVKQKFLGVRYQTMEEYNRAAGEVAEPYRLLVIADFPSRFSDDAARRLVSIVTNGPATGVHVLAMVDVEQQLPYNFSLGDLERTATVIVSDATRDVWREPAFDTCCLTLDQGPALEVYDRIVSAVARAAQDQSQVRVPFARYVPEQARWWTGDARAGIEVPIGRMGAQDVQTFAMDEELASSALVIGRQGSGKTTLLHTLITNLAIRYSPDELELYLLDLKRVEFEDYAACALPHARVVAVQSEREFGLSVLRGLLAEYIRRTNLLAESGCISLSRYRSETGRRLPRILLVVDEFQELFSEDDALAGEAGQILDRLIRLGRAFGINTLLASQTLAGPYSLSRATKDLIPVRIALQCADADSRLVLSDENNAAQLLQRPGEALYNAKNGLVEGNRLFQVFWLDPEERERLIRIVSEKAVREGYVPPQPQIVYRGNVPAHVESNRDLADLLAADHWPEPQRAVKAWLGEPVAIKPHTAAIFRRQSRSNLLIVGQNQYEQAAVAMLLDALISLAAQHRPDAARFVMLDLTNVDEPWHDLPDAFAQAFPHEVQVVRRRGAAEALQQLAGELSRRLAAEGDLHWPSLYLTILGLHRARDLRLDENDRYRAEDEPTPPAELLATICREGPDVGVHTLLWCDTYASLERVLDRNPEQAFDMRVALQMSGDESRRLLDSEAADRLGPNRALYYDEDSTGRLEKFRPYELATADQVRQWGAQLGGRR